MFSISFYIVLFIRLIFEQMLPFKIKTGWSFFISAKVEKKRHVFTIILLIIISFFMVDFEVGINNQEYTTYCL